MSANALTTVELELPADRVGDIPYIRAELKRILLARRREEASFTATLAVVPYLPVRALRPVAHAALGTGKPVTSASHVGVLPQAVVDAAGPAKTVIMNLGMQHPAGVAVPERVNAVLAEAPASTVALHISAATDSVSDSAALRAALWKALQALGVEPRELL